MMRSDPRLYTEFSNRSRSAFCNCYGRSPECGSHCYQQYGNRPCCGHFLLWADDQKKRLGEEHACLSLHLLFFSSELYNQLSSFPVGCSLLLFSATSPAERYTKRLCLYPASESSLCLGSERTMLLILCKKETHISTIDHKLGHRETQPQLTQGSSVSCHSAHHVLQSKHEHKLPAYHEKEEKKLESSYIQYLYFSTLCVKDRIINPFMMNNNV